MKIKLFHRINQIHAGVLYPLLASGTLRHYSPENTGLIFKVEFIGHVNSMTSAA